MEKYKLLYLRRFLRRKEGFDLESCIKELEGLKEKALKCYDDIVTDGFCQMLLLDGCFVVEFIRECSGKYPKKEGKILNSDFFIMRDLILLENQLPFFVLNKLYDMTKRDNEPSFVKIAYFNPITFFVDLPKLAFETFEEITGGNIKHLLHLQHEISCRVCPRKKPEDDEAGGCYNIKNFVCRHLRNAGNGFCKALSKLRRMVTSNARKPSKSTIEAGNGKDKDDQRWLVLMQNATELSEAGVRFAKASFKTNVFDSIKFENGSMIIPRFRVQDITEILLRNLIAYEQQSIDVKPKRFSNFAAFIDNLIESNKDVNLLCHNRIIENLLGDNKEVANLFNKIGNGVLIPVRNFYYKEQCKKAVKHCKKPWNKMEANLLRNYFSSPWVGASTVAAIVLLLLTLLQTILAFIDLVNK